MPVYFDLTQTAILRGTKVGNYFHIAEKNFRKRVPASIIVRSAWGAFQLPHPCMLSGKYHPVASGTGIPDRNVHREPVFHRSWGMNCHRVPASQRSQERNVHRIPGSDKILPLSGLSMFAIHHSVKEIFVT